MWIHSTLFILAIYSGLSIGFAEQWTIQTNPTLLITNQTSSLFPKHIKLVLPLSGNSTTVWKELLFELQQISIQPSTVPVNSIDLVNNNTKPVYLCSYNVTAGYHNTADPLSHLSGQISLFENGLRGFVQVSSCSEFPQGFELHLEPSSQTSPIQSCSPIVFGHFHFLHNVTITLGSDQLQPDQQLGESSSYSISRNTTQFVNQLPTLFRNMTSFSSIQQIADTHGLRQLDRKRRSFNRLRSKRSFIPTFSNQSWNSMLSRPMRILHRPNKSLPYVLELYLVVDQVLVNSFRDKQSGPVKYGDLLNFVYTLMAKVNAIFAPFNINVVVVNLELWESDRVDLKVEEHHILSKLIQFKRQFASVRCDCLHALLGAKASRARGSANPRSMCVFSKCVGYTRVHPGRNLDLVARTVAHELGHNFGLRHDTEECACQNCIMATGAEAVQYNRDWSPCSMNDMPTLLAYGMGLCLHDTPRHQTIQSVYNSSSSIAIPLIPVQSIQAVRRQGLVRRNFCGDGILDPGEECDCGTIDSCPDELRDCCDVTRCRLRPGSTCAGGPCCQANRVSSSNSTSSHYQCSLAPSGAVCRAESGTCDLPEYCDGRTQWCPADVYKADGIECRTSEGTWAYCMRGGCREANSWCRVLWGNSGKMANGGCFDWNKVAMYRPRQPICDMYRSNNGDRSNDLTKWHGIACPTWRDPECGRLWCHHRNEKAMLLGWIDSKHLHPPLVYKSCSALVYDPVWPSLIADPLQSAGVNLASAITQDAGLVPDGTPCSRGMCYNGTCMRLRDFEKTKPNCNCRNPGICNNLGHCHCMFRFHPPHCNHGGNGGSIDSGPPPPPDAPLSDDQILAICLTVVVSILALIIVFLINKHRRRCLHWSADPILPTNSGLCKPFDRDYPSFVWQCCHRSFGSPRFVFGSKQVKTSVQTVESSATQSIQASNYRSYNGYLHNGNAFNQLPDGKMNKTSTVSATCHPKPSPKLFPLGFKYPYFRMKKHAAKNPILISSAASIISSHHTSPELSVDVEPPAQIDDRVASLRNELENILTWRFESIQYADTALEESRSPLTSLTPCIPKPPRENGHGRINSSHGLYQTSTISPPQFVTMSYTGSVCSLDQARDVVKRQRKRTPYMNGNCKYKTKWSGHSLRRRLTSERLTYLLDRVRKRPSPSPHSTLTTAEPRLTVSDISQPQLQSTSSKLPLRDLNIVLNSQQI